MRLLLGAILMSAQAMASAAAASSCRVALTLALDVSSSVDAEEYRLQLHGVANALTDPAVRDAILQVPGTGVALQIFEWSGIDEQVIVSDWKHLRSAEDLDRLAALLYAHERQLSDGQTAVGQALVFAHAQIQRAPECWATKIDVSGDGQSNVGMHPQDIYWEHDFRGITVNGLAIEASVTALTRYYEEFVIRGPDAFAIRAADFADFARAIREKLVRELGVPEVGMLDTQ